MSHSVLYYYLLVHRYRESFLLLPPTDYSALHFALLQFTKVVLNVSLEKAQVPGLGTQGPAWWRPGSTRTDLLLSLSAPLACSHCSPHPLSAVPPTGTPAQFDFLHLTRTIT